MPTEQMLSVAEAVELQPGDAQNATWINPGMQGVVRKIERKMTKAGKPFFPCVIADTTGSATIEVSFFTAPKFGEGDLIELSGQGLRRTEYNGKPQAAIGQKTEVHVIGKHVHAEEQTQRAAAGAPAIDGTLQPVQGQTVGMAMKEALAIVVFERTGGERGSPIFWEDVYTVASDIIRVSRLLESGKLAPSVKERAGGHSSNVEAAAAAVAAPAAAAKPATAKGKPTERELANLTHGDEDVPF